MHTLAYSTPLPVFENDVQAEALIDAYEVLSQPYDGSVNKEEIQPYRYVGPDAYGRLRPLEPVGQPYTIRPDHLARLIIAHNARMLTQQEEHDHAQV